MKKTLIIFVALVANLAAGAFDLYNFFSLSRVNNVASLANQFSSPAVFFYNPFMQPTLFFYVLTSLALGLSLVLALKAVQYKFVDKFFDDPASPYFTALSLIVPVGLIVSRFEAIIPALILSWGGIWLAWKVRFKLVTLACFLRSRPIFKFVSQVVGPHLVLWGSLAFMAYLFIPLVVTTPQIMNPFFRIPQMYHGDGMVERDTTSIINDLGLGYDYLDIFNYRNWKNNQACQKAPASDERLSKFVNDYMNGPARPLAGSYRATGSFILPPLLYYAEGTLCFIPAYGPLDYKKQAHEKLRAELAAIGFDPGPYEEPPPPNRDDYSFLYLKQANLERIYVSTQGGQLKHHIYYLFPIYELLLGKPLEKTVIQYGLGYSLLMSAVGQVVRLAGISPTYGLALQFLSGFILIGLAVYVVSLHLIFKDIRLTSLAALVALVNYLIRGADVALVAPGIGEIRFLFDLPVLYVLYRYAQTLKSKYLGRLGVFLGLALFVNFDFGLLLASSILGALFVLRLAEPHQRPPWSFFLFGAALIGLAGALNSLPSPSMGSLFLVGFFSFKVGLANVAALIVVFGVYLAMFVKMRANGSKFSYPFLASVFYGQALLCYYIIMGVPSHFYFLWARLALPLLLFFAYLFKEKNSLRAFSNIIYYLAVGVLTFVGYVQYEEYRHFNQEVERVFKSHKVYQWDKYGTNVRSTLNPAFFEPAVEIIKKYIPGEKGIYLISQYDFMLSFLAKKYSGMPHFDLMGNLATVKSIEDTIDHLKRQQPKYLFVDSDITAPYELNIASHNLSWMIYINGRMRLLAMRHLREIFEAVRDDYVLLEEGQLISVYRLKD